MLMSITLSLFPCMVATNSAAQVAMIRRMAGVAMRTRVKWSGDDCWGGGGISIIYALKDNRNMFSSLFTRRQEYSEFWIMTSTWLGVYHTIVTNDKKNADNKRTKKIKDCSALSVRKNIGLNTNEHAKNGWLRCVTNFCLNSLKAVIEATVPSAVCRSHLIHQNLLRWHAAAKESVVAAIMPLKYVNRNHHVHSVESRHQKQLKKATWC